MAPNALAVRARVRQILVTPQILGIPIEGGALNMLYDIAQEEISLQRPIAVFTPFDKAIVHIKNKLEKLFKDNIYIIKGGMTSNDIQEEVDGFQNNKNINKVVIATIKSVYTNLN